MYINKIDDAIDAIIDDFYVTVISKNPLFKNIFKDKIQQAKSLKNRLLLEAELQIKVICRQRLYLEVEEDQFIIIQLRRKEFKDFQITRQNLEDIVDYIIVIKIHQVKLFLSIIHFYRKD